MAEDKGVELIETGDGNFIQIKNQKRKVKFDGKYPYKPRNIFFRAWSAFLRGLAICVFNPFMVMKYHMWTFGVKNQKKLKGKPFIMTCNHVHMFEDVAVGSNLFCWRKIYFTTLEQNIRRPMIGFFLRSLGGIPIPTGSIAGVKKYEQDIGEILKEGKPVLYNPEGSLWPYKREIRQFRRGAFSMAVKNDVPVLPIVVLFKRKQRRNGKYSYKINFAICNPIEVDKKLSPRDASDKLRNQAFEVTNRVAREWYEIQDCGFGDEKIKRELIPGKTLHFEDDQWIVTINADERKRALDKQRTRDYKEKRVEV